MPYSGPDDPKLPANVKSLPADKRSQWIQIWNRSFAACMKGGGGNCEQISFRNANGVVLSDMMTRDLEGVEVLREGTWNGVPFPIERLDQMVEAHKALRGILDPPIKLGHDDNQRLLQKDGYSAAGWVENLRRVGSRLVADLKQVPAMVADLIEVGAIRKRSSEVRFQLMAGGQTWPAVLTGLALLGLDDKANVVEAVTGLVAIRKQTAGALKVEERDLTPDMVVKLTRRGPTPKPDPDPDPAPNPDPDPEIARLKIELTDARTRLLTVEGQIGRGQAEALVDGAVREGRLLPRQRDEALKLALRDEDSFKTFLETQPKGLVDTSERGSAGRTSAGGVDLVALEPTEVEVQTAKGLGVWNSQYRLDLMRQKAAEKGIELPDDFGKEIKPDDKK